MKKILFAIILIPFLSLNAQKIGEMAPERTPQVFPLRTWGVDFMFSEGGFGLGTFFRYRLSSTLTAFTDISISESKDQREVEYFDYWGNKIVPNKKNRVFLLPLNFGLQQRLFSKTLADNLRPYVNFGAGPTMVFTTPYEKEFFSSFSKAHAKYTLGGYVGIGANFGSDKSNLVGINVRYYMIHFFDEGVESLENRYQKTLGGFFLTINIGMMY